MPPGFWGQVGSLLAADLRREWRGRAVVGLMVSFVCVTGLILNFTFNLALESRVATAVGAFWTALLFATILGLGRVFVLDGENGVWEGLTLILLDPGGLFLAKLGSNLLFLTVLDSVAVPVFAALYNLPLLHGAVLLPIALGTLALGAAGTLFVPLAGASTAREILLPVVLLPLLVPVLIGAVQATVAALTPATAGQPPWTGLLAACAALFLGSGYLLYGYLLDD